jgi:hypothetical protein
LIPRPCFSLLGSLTFLFCFLLLPLLIGAVFQLHMSFFSLLIDEDAGWWNKQIPLLYHPFSPFL